MWDVLRSLKSLWRQLKGVLFEAPRFKTGVVNILISHLVKREKDNFGNGVLMIYYVA